MDSRIGSHERLRQAEWRGSTPASASTAAAGNPARRAEPRNAQRFPSWAGQASPDAAADGQQEQQPADQPAPQGPRKQATETIAQRAGALTDEIDFKAFVAGLVHGTFDAIVDASIRQMEAYASLVSAVAKSVEDFTAENVTLNQARDFLVEQHPEDLQLDLTTLPKWCRRPRREKIPNRQGRLTG